MDLSIFAVLVIIIRGIKAYSESVLGGWIFRFFGHFLIDFTCFSVVLIVLVGLQYRS